MGGLRVDGRGAGGPVVSTKAMRPWFASPDPLAAAIMSRLVTTKPRTATPLQMLGCLASRPPVLLGLDEVRLNEPRPDSAIDERLSVGQSVGD